MQEQAADSKAQQAFNPIYDSQEKLDDKKNTNQGSDQQQIVPPSNQDAVNDYTDNAQGEAVTDAQIVGQDLAPQVLEGGNSTFKTQFGSSQNDQVEPDRCLDSVTRQRDEAEDSKVRLIQAQEIIQGAALSQRSKNQQDAELVQKIQQRNQILESKLAEADELVHHMSKLIDVSRNKQLQRMLIKFTESSYKLLNESQEDATHGTTFENQIPSYEEYPSNTIYEDGPSGDPSSMDQGSVSSGPLQMKKGRQQSNIRVRDGKKKVKKQQSSSSGFDFNQHPNKLAPLSRSSSSKKEKSSSRVNQTQGQGTFNNMRSNSPIQEKPKRKGKKKVAGDQSNYTHQIASNTAEMNFMTAGAGGNPNANIVQNVETFKNFLLQNDSQFSEYLNSDLLKNTFDTHMMKEGMITFMAQMMGNGSAKDNFFLKTRSALQDTMTLFFITRNISFNNNIEFYLPRLVEMLSDLLEVERCSIFLYDGVKDQLYCKVITGRLREAISFEREKPNILSTVFNTGQTVYIKDCSTAESKEQCGEYLNLNQKLHTVTRNVLVAPIKLGNNAIGCLEVANKRKVQDFTSNDIEILTSVCDQISNGLIAHEMKYNIKKESDEELRYIKGLMNQSLNSFLIPMVAEINNLCISVLKSEKVLFFMYNKDIDHLYTISTKPNQVVGQFGIDSIRMKSNLGLSGSAFTHGKIMIERDIEENTKDQKSVMCPEEKDYKKLQLESLKNAIAIPIFDKQTGSSIAVVQAYNFDEQNYLGCIDENILMSLSNIFSSTIFNVDNLQGIMTNSDLLQAQFDLGNEACVFVNTQQMVTKMNKSAEIIFNTTSSVSIGLQVSEFLGVKNNHFMSTLNKLTNRNEAGDKESEKDNQDDSGQIGGGAGKELAPHLLTGQLIGTFLISNLGRESKADVKENKIPVNFYAHRLTTEHQKTYGFCLIFQPIIIIK